jgi:hypothetical protein
LKEESNFQIHIPSTLSYLPSPIRSLKQESNFKIKISSPMSYIPSSNPFLEREKQFQNPNSRTNELHPFLQSVHKKKKAILKSQFPHQ